MELHIEEHFFGLNEAQSLELKPLTIIIGKNGTGKTKLLKKVKAEYNASHCLSIEERVQFATQAQAQAQAKIKSLQNYQALVSDPTLLAKVSGFYEAHFGGLTLEVQNNEELIFRKKGQNQAMTLSEVSLTISSLLPILIAAYYPESLPIQIINQPELMLYPALAAEVAEVLASSVINKAQKRTYVIETHSSDLVLRLRVLIAEGKLNPGDVMIYYLEEDEEEEREHWITKIKVDDQGDVGYWPEGFFSSTLDETIRIRTAQLAKTKEGQEV